MCNGWEKAVRRFLRSEGAPQPRFRLEDAGNNNAIIPEVTHLATFWLRPRRIIQVF
jgi:hypothetical protein